MKSIFVVFAAVFLTIGMPWVFSQIDDTLTEEYTQTFSGKVTSAGEFSSNVTLAESIFNSSITSIKAVSSNLTGSDAPSASSYNSVSGFLVIDGLDQSLTRTLAVEYLIPHTSLPAYFADILALFRWFYLFILMGTAGGAIYAFFTS